MPRRAYLIWGLAFGLIAALIVLIAPEPVADKWAAAHAHFILVLVVLRPSDLMGRAIVVALIFVQWFLIGAGIRYVISRSR